MATPSHLVRACLVAAAFLPSQAAILAWPGADGSWDTSAVVWDSGTSAWTDTTGRVDIASFGATAGTVTLDGTISALGLSFSSAGYTLSGGTLNLGTSGIAASGLSSGTTAITSNLALLSGPQTWNIGTGSTLALSGGTFSRTAGSLLRITNASTVTSTMTGLATNTNGLVGPWAIVGSGSSARFATFSGSSIVEFDTYPTTTTTASGQTSGFGWSTAYTESYNAKVIGTTSLTIGSGTGAFGVARTANTVLYTGAAFIQTWGNSGTASHELTLTFNALLNAGSGTLTLAPGSSQGVLRGGSSGELLLVAETGDIVIRSRIDNASSGTGSLTLIAASGRLITINPRAGGGTDTATDNRYTGVTTISGKVQTNVSGAFGTAATGSSSIILANGPVAAQLILGATGVNIPRPLVIQSGGYVGEGALYYNQNSGTATWSGNISILGDATAGGHFATLGNSGTLVLSGNVTSANHEVNIRQGAITFSGAANSFSRLLLAQGILRLGANNTLPTASLLRLGNNSSTSTFDLNNFNQTLAGLSTSSTGTRSITNNGADLRTLTLTGSTIAGVANTVISNTSTGGSLTFSAGTGGLNLVLDAGASTPVIHATRATSLAVSLTSTNGLTKTGNAELILTTNNLAGLGGVITVGQGILVARESGALGTALVELDNVAGGEAVRFDTKSQTHATNFEVLESGDIRTSNVTATLNGDFTLHQDKTLRFYGLGGANNRFAITGNTLLAVGSTAANITFQTDASQTHNYTGSMNLGAGTLAKSGTARLDMAGSLVAGAVNASGGTFNLASAVTAGGADDSLSITGNSNSNFSGGITAAAVAKTGTGQVSIAAASDIDTLSVEAGSIVLAGGANGRLGASSALSLGAADTSGKLILGSAAGATNQTLSALTLSGLGGSIVGGNGSADSILTLDLASELSLGAFLGGAGTNENRIGLAKTGAGVLTLSAANTFAGGTTLNAGTLLLGDVGALGSGAVTVGTGTTLDLANLAITNAIVFAGGSVINNGAWAGSASVTGAIDNDYLASLPGSSFTIAAGSSVDLSSLTALGGKTLVYSGGTLTGSSNVLVEIADGTTLGAGFGAGRALVKAGTVTLTSGFAQAVRYEGGTLAGLADYSGALTVGGNSIFDLDGSGNTAVTTAASVTVESGSTLKGTGTFGGGVISGIHAPGNSPGIQTSQGNLTYSAGSSFEWELADNTDVQGNPTATFDQVIVNGDLNFAGATSLSLVFNSDGSTIDWTNVFWDDAKSWVLYDVSGSLAGLTNLVLQSGTWNDIFDASLASARPGFTFALSQSGSDVLLNYEAIPEPSTYGLILGTLALAGAAYRRRAQLHSGTA